MEVYFNATTQELIVVKDHKAFSRFLYLGDNPYDIAMQMLYEYKDLSKIPFICDELLPPAIKPPQDPPQTQIIEQPTNTIKEPTKQE